MPPLYFIINSSGRLVIDLDLPPLIFSWRDRDTAGPAQSFFSSAGGTVTSRPSILFLHWRDDDMPQAQHNHFFSSAGGTRASRPSITFIHWRDNGTRTQHNLHSSMALLGAPSTVLLGRTWHTGVHSNALTCWPLDPLAQGSSSAGWALPRTIPG